MKEDVKKIYDLIREKTEVDAIELKLEKAECGILESKIGGAYYNPEGMEIPVDGEDGETMLYLLAQINYAQMPKLEDFPQKGLLQIFIKGDDLYGAEFDDESKQVGWRIRFIEEVPDEGDIKNNEIIELNTENEKDVYLPFEVGDEYRLIPKKVKRCMNQGDYRIDNLVKENKDIFGDIERIWDLDEDVFEEIDNMIESFGCQIGGYPSFTQSDPRGYCEEGDTPDVLLLQIDSEEDILWGDCGIANFFITKDDLKNKRFDRVWYNWDCS